MVFAPAWPLSAGRLFWAQPTRGRGSPEDEQAEDATDDEPDGCRLKALVACPRMAATQNTDLNIALFERAKGVIPAA